MDQEVRQLHRRLDQVEHLLNQHNGRQKRLEKALGDFEQFREETLSLASQLKATKKAATLTETMDGLTTSLEELRELVGELDKTVNNNVTQLAFLAEKVG